MKIDYKQLIETNMYIFKMNLKVILDCCLDQIYINAIDISNLESKIDKI